MTLNDVDGRKTGVSTTTFTKLAITEAESWITLSNCSGPIVWGKPASKTFMHSRTAFHPLPTELRAPSLKALGPLESNPFRATNSDLCLMKEMELMLLERIQNRILSL